MDKPPVLRVIQITDTHLFNDESACLQGLNTLSTFKQVIKEIKRQQSQIDLVLVTGDIAQDHQQPTYEKFITLMQQAFSCPVHWIPGNHDDVNAMRAADTAGFENTFFTQGNWQFAMLNSGVPKKVYGRIEPRQLDQLDQFLQQNHAPTLICFHHHPVLMHSAWIDDQKIDNAERLLKIAHHFPQVKALAWGHVHQESEQKIDHIRYLSTPSTCFQFKPMQQQYQLDQRLPGYRWFELSPNGDMQTGVCRVDVAGYDVNIDSGGY